MTQFASILSVYIRMRYPSSGESDPPMEALPMVDRTGLTGEYDVALDSRPNGNLAVAEQLGLRLEPRKLEVEAIVVDSAVMPAN
jgi:uncharacterized protein (TIGR03435 family)